MKHTPGNDRSKPQARTLQQRRDSKRPAAPRSSKRPRSPTPSEVDEVEARESFEDRSASHIRRDSYGGSHTKHKAGKDGAKTDDMDVLDESEMSSVYDAPLKSKAKRSSGQGSKVPDGKAANKSEKGKRVCCAYCMELLPAHLYRLVVRKTQTRG
jgi:hypothetical protein